MIIRSNAKINLALDILRRDSSGFHEIQTVYLEIPELFDDIEIHETVYRDIRVLCDAPGVPLDDTNTVYKAARMMQKQFGIWKGVRIHLHKRIPLFSGLGGGSSNAAAVMKGLNIFWGINASSGELAALSNQIGMDAAFFFYGGTALGARFGEKIEPLSPFPPEIKIEILDTGVKMSSREAYGMIDLAKCGKNTEKTEELIEGLREKNPAKILKNIHNDFEPFIFEKFPELAKKARIANAHLSGSGGALFVMQ